MNRVRTYYVYMVGESSDDLFDCRVFSGTVIPDEIFTNAIYRYSA
jgi:hypothetical protein